MNDGSCDRNDWYFKKRASIDSKVLGAPSKIVREKSSNSNSVVGKPRSPQPQPFCDGLRLPHLKRDKLTIMWIYMRILSLLHGDKRP